MPTKALPLAERFWRYVNKRGPLHARLRTRCWEWMGAKLRSGGYGALSDRHGIGPHRAHRLSWELHHGPIPPGLEVCHACDNPPCVRPSHLFVGTHSANVTDMVAKGRARGGAPRGARHPQAKLTDATVRAMRTVYSAGATSYAELAAKHGVSKKTVLNVIHRRIWTHA